MVQVVLAYLPPYAPDLNPIEEGFAEIKAWCKKHYKDVETMKFEEVLNYALASVKNGAQRHFVHSEVGIPIREGSEEDYWDD